MHPAHLFSPLMMVPRQCKNRGDALELCLFWFLPLGSGCLRTKVSEERSAVCLPKVRDRSAQSNQMTEEWVTQNQWTAWSSPPTSHQWVLGTVNTFSWAVLPVPTNHLTGGGVGEPKPDLHVLGGHQPLLSATWAWPPLNSFWSHEMTKAFCSFYWLCWHARIRLGVAFPITCFMLSTYQEKFHLLLSVVLIDIKGTGAGPVNTLETLEATRYIHSACGLLPRIQKLMHEWR